MYVFIFKRSFVFVAGYGDIVPVTTGGKVFVGFYASFGIPLNVIFLADIGFLLAKLLIHCINAFKRWKQRKKGKESTIQMQQPQQERRVGTISRGISASRALSVHGPRPVCVVDEPDGPCKRDQGSIKRGNHRMTASTMMSTYGPKSVMMMHKNRTESKSVVVNSNKLNENRPKKHASLYPKFQDASFTKDQKTEVSDGFENIPLEDVENGLDQSGSPAENRQEKNIQSSEEREKIQSNDEELNVDVIEIMDIDEDHTEVPLIIVLLILITYILLGSLMIMGIEQPWNYSESLYFTLITLTTIGFGDMIPVNHYDESVFFICIIYTVVGLAVMSTCIALVQAKVLRAIDSFTAWVTSL